MELFAVKCVSEINIASTFWRRRYVFISSVCRASQSVRVPQYYA